MDGLIPLVLKALKKKKTMRRYGSLSSSSSHLLADVDVTEPSPQVPFFMTPQHPRASSRWHGGDGGNIFMTPQHPRAARWLHEDDDNGEPPAAAAAVPTAMVPTVVRAKNGNMRRRVPIMETPPPTLIRH